MRMRNNTVLLLALAILPAAGQFRPRPRIAMSPGHVARTITAALAKRGVVVSEEEIALPANVTATEVNPVLDVHSIEPLGHLHAGRPAESSFAVKLACRTPGACLPFFAVVTRSGADLEDTSAKLVTASLASTKPAQADVVIKSGAHATLLLEGHSGHIQLSVISLENGVIGRKIHVSSTDRKQIYVAEVVSATALKGSF